MERLNAAAKTLSDGTGRVCFAVKMDVRKVTVFIESHFFAAIIIFIQSIAYIALTNGCITVFFCCSLQIFRRHLRVS